MATKLNFLRELKEEGVIEVKWISGAENCADLFTKNLGRGSFEKHTHVFAGEDNYYKKK